NDRRNGERQVDRHVVDQVRHEQVEGEERRGQEEVVHGVDVNAADGGDDEHQKEEKEQRDRRKEADAPGQRAGLELLRHDHADLIAGKQVLVVPVQLPAIGGFTFLAGRESVVGEVDVLEIGRHGQMEVAHLGNLIAEFVAPSIHTLRGVANLERY